MTDPIKPSPQPEYGERDQTEEPTTNPGAPVDVAYLKKKMGEYEQTLDGELKKHDNRLTFRSVIVAICAVAVSVIMAIIFIDNRVQAQTDAGVKVHEERITTLEHQQTQLQGDVHEVQTDIRSLYKAVMTGRPQERLEKPAPEHKDGGVP